MSSLTLTNFPEMPYALEEAFNRLRVNISFCSEVVRKIMIVSSMPQEGKSFVAVQLWRTLAEAGIKTVLVDSDLRKSNLKERYQFRSESEIQGITYYLSGQVTLKDAVYQTNIENGDILPVGKTIMNPSMLLESNLYSEMLDQLTEQYRYVIVDAPPLGLVADGERIASLSDGTVFLVGSGMVSRSKIRHSLLQVKRAGCPLIGTVLNRVAGNGGSYYSKYGKYGKYASRYRKYGYYGEEKEQKSAKRVRKKKKPDLFSS